MHAPTTVYFFMAKRSSHWINVLGVEPSRYKNNDFYGGDEASTEKKRNRKGTKKVVQESQPPEDTPLGNDAKQRRIPALVIWYLPETDRLRRIFLNPKEAALMTW